MLGCLRLLDATKTRRFLLATWGEAVSSPDISAVVTEQLTDLRDMALDRYREWGSRELDFTEEELDGWLDVIGAAVLSVLTGVCGANPASGERKTRRIS